MTASRTVVIGGGLIGVTAAYELARRGESVTLLEANSGMGEETSFANGGMLTASMPDPWNGPGVGRHLISSLFDPYAPMKLRVGVIPSMVGWGVKFLRNSTASRHQETTKWNYQLARYSVAETAKLTDDLNLKYDDSSVGTLKVFESDQASQGPIAISEMLVPFGLRFDVLTPAEIVEKEPALAGIERKISTGLFYPDDRAGDALAFTRQLADRAKAAGVEVCTGADAKAVKAKDGRVVGIDLEAGFIDAERVVVAAGCGSPQVVRSLGVSLPIKPAKGYSVTIDVREQLDKPTIPIVDDAMHAAVTPLGHRLRAVGTAEFTGFDTSLTQARIDNLFALLHRLYPTLSERIDRGSAEKWAGLRPMSADGRPLIGQCGPDGLWVSAGHGHLGWTMAVGSAKLLVDQMLGESSAVNPKPFAIDR